MAKLRYCLSIGNNGRDCSFFISNTTHNPAPFRQELAQSDCDKVNASVRFAGVFNQMWHECGLKCGTAIVIRARLALDGAGACFSLGVIT